MNRSNSRTKEAQKLVSHVVGSILWYIYIIEVWVFIQWKGEVERSNLGGGVGHSVSDVSNQAHHILIVNHDSNPWCNVANESHWVAEEVDRAQYLQCLVSNSLMSLHHHDNIVLYIGQRQPQLIEVFVGFSYKLIVGIYRDPPMNTMI